MNFLSGLPVTPDMEVDAISTRLHFGDSEGAKQTAVREA